MRKKMLTDCCAAEGGCDHLGDDCAACMKYDPTLIEYILFTREELEKFFDDAQKEVTVGRDGLTDRTDFDEFMKGRGE